MTGTAAPQPRAVETGHDPAPSVRLAKIDAMPRVYPRRSLHLTYHP